MNSAFQNVFNNFVKLSLDILEKTTDNMIEIDNIIKTKVIENTNDNELKSELRCSKLYDEYLLQLKDYVGTDVYDLYMDGYFDNSDLDDDDMETNEMITDYYNDFIQNNKQTLIDSIKRKKQINSELPKEMKSKILTWIYDDDDNEIDVYYYDDDEHQLLYDNDGKLYGFYDVDNEYHDLDSGKYLRFGIEMIIPNKKIDYSTINAQNINEYVNDFKMINICSHCEASIHYDENYKNINGLCECIIE